MFFAHMPALFNALCVIIFTAPSARGKSWMRQDSYKSFEWYSTRHRPSGYVRTFRLCLISTTSLLDIPRVVGSVPHQAQLVRGEWDDAVAKAGPLEVGESVVFTHGAGVVESLGVDGRITIKAASGKSYTFSSHGGFDPPPPPNHMPSPPPPPPPPSPPPTPPRRRPPPHRWVRVPAVVR